MNTSLKEEAIFIADSHYNKKNQDFIYLLKRIEKDDFFTSQIFLMGDNFDFLSVESKYFVEQNHEVIDSLNQLSLKKEIIYLEGNHDFNLQKLFPNIKVIKREEQPFLVKYKSNIIALSHGDNFVDWKYELFCKIIRNSFLLWFLNFIDIKFFISKKIEEVLLKKDICHKISNFEKIAKNRVKNYNSNIIIEGHYHQGSSFNFENKEYINVPSLCCQKSFIRFKDNQFIEEK
ncbi:UDP-2,3-diacylglucosamine diphosphatase [Arcobacter lanthieri]|uniref:UDP-2,3-diacylglucosamine diphosphatase n=1 Tax=Aliarcobacter lanthieri TaxID=1355374 RepID=UPI001924FAA2|nr:metallophosphoesterase [Aliarcobacter lanthieri]MBL3520734.1 UDP-2,3-diacylglucosamine diphosphatase [Aliarcobacter lanthieri]